MMIWACIPLLTFVKSEEIEEAKADSDKSVLEENEGVLGKDVEVAQAIKAATETANYTKVRIWSLQRRNLLG